MLENWGLEIDWIFLAVLINLIFSLLILALVPLAGVFITIALEFLLEQRNDDH
jgi:hypothetical protein